MKLPLVDHARLLIDELARRQGSDRRIPLVSSREVLNELGQSPKAGVNLGRAVALLDAACATEDLPWLGRLVVFENAKNDFSGEWAAWAPFKTYIVDFAPRRKRWSDAEFTRLREALQRLPTDPDTWWTEALKESETWLLRVLLVVLQQTEHTP